MFIKAYNTGGELILVNIIHIMQVYKSNNDEAIILLTNGTQIFTNSLVEKVIEMIDEAQN